MTPPETTPPARRRWGSAKNCLLAALAVLNAALLCSLLGRFVPDNSATAAAAQARASEYVLMPSRPLGLNQDVLYVLDADNGNLIVVGYNQNGNAGGSMEFTRPVPLSQFFRR